MIEVLFGIFAGIVTSLGMGGGTILALLFSLTSEISQHIIQGINLIFFIPTAIVSICTNIKKKNIDYNFLKWIIFPGTFGAIIGCFSSFKFSNLVLKKYFGIFLLCIAVFEIISFIKQYILNKKENNK